MTPEVSKALADAGPWAVVVFIGAALGLGFARVLVVLWRDHLRADLDDRIQRDAALADLRVQIEAAKANADSSLALARAVGELTAEVATAVKGVAAIRRDMATRRKAP